MYNLGIGEDGELGNPGKGAESGVIIQEGQGVT